MGLGLQHSSFVSINLLDLSDRDDCQMKTEVIATNRPHDLDSVDASEKERHCNSLEPWNVKRCSTGDPDESPEAILDRLDESVEFGLPDLDARKAGDSASIGPPKIHC